MTPFTDAVRFVDRDLGNIPVERALQKGFHHQPLGRDVEQTKFIAMESTESCARFVCVKR